MEEGTQDRIQARVQLFHYMIQPEHLGYLWQRLGFYIRQQPEFEDSCILLTTKNVKASFRDREWARMCGRFWENWDAVVDRGFLVQDFYDVAKEVTAPESRNSHQEPELPPSEPMTLTWRRCCLERFDKWLQGCQIELGGQGYQRGGDGSCNEEEQGNPGETADFSRADDVGGDSHAPPGWKSVYYPVSLAQDMGSITVEPSSGRGASLRRNGLLYA